MYVFIYIYIYIQYVYIYMYIYTIYIYICNIYIYIYIIYIYKKLFNIAIYNIAILQKCVFCFILSLTRVYFKRFYLYIYIYIYIYIKLFLPKAVRTSPYPAISDSCHYCRPQNNGFSIRSHSFLMSRGEEISMQ